MSIANVNDARKKMTNALTSLNKLGNGQTWIKVTKNQMKNTIGRLKISRNNSAMQPKPTKMIIKKNMFGKTRYYVPSVNGGVYTQVRKNYQYNKNIRTAPARAVRSTYRAVKNMSKNKRAAVSSRFAGITSYLSNSIAQLANRTAKAAANASAKSAAARNQIRMQRNANIKATANRRAQINAARF